MGGSLLSNQQRTIWNILNFGIFANIHRFFSKKIEKCEIFGGNNV